MVKNEYRRALIMLRPNEQGYSGHVRLERRTLMGSMYFIVNTPDTSGELMAALVGSKNGEYFAANLGTLRRDGRGQAGLSYSYDPRNIGGHMLEDYQMIAVVRRAGDDCTLVLTGNVNGACEMTYPVVRDVVCALYTPVREPAQDLPAQPSTTNESTASARVITSTKAQPVMSKGIQMVRDMPQREIQEYTAPARIVVPETPAVPKTPIIPETLVVPEILVVPETPVIPEPLVILEPLAEVEPLVIPVPEVKEEYECEVATQTAAEELGIEISEPWTAAIESLRELFATQAAEAMPFEDDYVYVRAPMPEQSGYSHCMIGLRVRYGRVNSVRYALPSHFSVEQPAGLEDYIWMGGASVGWWVLTADPNTGAPEA